MLYSKQKNIMKKFSMGIAALIMLAPAPFMLDKIYNDQIIIILIIALLCWVILEFYIALSRPYEGKTQFKPLAKFCRMACPFFAIYSWLDFGNAWTLLYFPLWFRVLLILIYILALGIRIWAIIHLGKSFSYDVKKPEGGSLITTGPYRIVRHPSYLAICILASLPGLILGSIPGFIGLVATTIPVVVLRTNAEEKILEKEFGNHFLKYKDKSYRLFPFIY